MRMSASRVKTWMNCPLQAFFKYNLKLPTQKSSAMVFGNCVHTAAEHYNHHGDVEKAVEMFKEIWDDPSKIGLEIQTWNKRQNAGTLREKGIKLLRGLDERVKREGRIMVATEHPFLVPIGDHELVGYVDLLEVRTSGRGKEVLRIVDYKTGAKQPYQDALRNDVQFCADEDTEILSERGWLRYDELVPGENVLTLNSHSGLAEWQPATSVNIFPTKDQSLLSMESKAHSSLTTKNHRWYVEHNVCSQKGWRREDRVVSSQNLSGSDRIRCAAPVSNLPVKSSYSDAFVELMAWYWTEGRDLGGKSGFVLSQSKDKNPELVNRIVLVLTELFGPAVKSLRGLGRPGWRLSNDPDVCRFFVNGQAAQSLVDLIDDRKTKTISPTFITGLTFDQLHLFIDVSIWADGSEQNGCRVITQREKSRLDIFQMACSLAGYRTSLREQAVGGSGVYAGRQFWLLSIKDRRPYHQVKKSQNTYVSYTGNVWCPTTENETWLARRNGQVYFTGNTIYDYASRQPEFWLGWPGDPEFPGMPDGGTLWDKYKDFPRRGIYWHLSGDKELDVGERTEDDFKRLYRVIDEIDRADKAKVYVPCLSGESCVWCDFTEECGLTIPSSEDRMSGLDWF